jgi:hypothetical protein
MIASRVNGVILDRSKGTKTSTSSGTLLPTAGCGKIFSTGLVEFEAMACLLGNGEPRSGLITERGFPTDNGWLLDAGEACTWTSVRNQLARGACVRVDPA